MYWDILGCIGIYWDALGCIGMHWDVLGCIGMYWDVLGCIGMHWDGIVVVISHLLPLTPYLSSDLSPLISNPLPLNNGP